MCKILCWLGGFNPGAPFNSTPVPMFSPSQPSPQPPMLSGDMMLPGSVGGFPPTGQKYMAPPVSGQMLHPNQAPRSGESTPQRITPQPHGAYPSTLPGSYGQPLQAPNGLSSSFLPPGNLPGNGFNRSSSAPTNVFQTNGPPSAAPGMSPAFGPRPPSSSPGLQQSPYMVGNLKDFPFILASCVSFGKVIIQLQYIFICITPYGLSHIMKIFINEAPNGLLLIVYFHLSIL